MTTLLERLLEGLPRPPKYVYDWPALAALEPLTPWIARMEATPQEPEWHGEGDVWAHTRLVCDALSGLPEFHGMDDEPRDALALAALLHDIGKPATTRMEDGRLVAPRHGPLGAKLARRLLWQAFGLCGTDGAMRFREAVCLLIRYHTRPPHLIEGKNTALQALKPAANGELAPGFTLRALCLLAQADVLGRIASDSDEFLERIALAREMIREEGCLDGPYPFRSARTRRALLSGGRVWKDQELFDDSWGEVLLMCGLPGVGKDTWLAKNRPGLPMVCLDDIRREMGIPPEENQGRVVQAARERAKAYLREKRPFAWNATSLTSLRAQQIELFESYHARVRVVYLETGWEEDLRRNAGRADAVPEDVIGGMLDRLEPPERWEAQDVEWRCL